MAKKLSLAEFLETVQKSKLLEPGRLEAYCLDQSDALTAPELANRMLRDKLLTKFQAENLLKGRWHRYFLGPYRVLDRLGMGASGMVYLCEHTKMKRRVAVKVLQAEKAQNEEAVRRFEREAMAAAAVRHPNIVHAYDLCREDRLHYLVMEYVDGVSLLKKLADGGRLSPREAAGFLWQAAAGLQVAHEGGIVHRDIKPSNLMLTKAGKLKILDLGLALYAGDDTELTRGDAILGVAAYIAPEQAINSHKADARSDLYSLGATFYLAVTGKKPPIAGDKITPPSARNPDEDGDYQQILGVIRKLMATKPLDRYQSANEVVFALAPFVDRAVESTPDDASMLTPAPFAASQPELLLPERVGSDPTIDTPVPAVATAARAAVAKGFAAGPASLPPIQMLDNDLPPVPMPTFGNPFSPNASGRAATATVTRPTVSPRPRPTTVTPPTSPQSLLPWLFLAVASVAFLAAGAYLIWG